MWGEMEMGRWRNEWTDHWQAQGRLFSEAGKKRAHRQRKTDAR